jgi:glycine/D-amino acid oxidase-like deaminating enzyme
LPLLIPPLTCNEGLPARADAVVIGAGIAGVATALELQERGLSVVIVEKGEVACEQSSRNWGWVRQMGRDSREVPLMLKSLELWRTINQRIAAETGFRQCGITYLCATPQDMAAKEKWYRTVAKPYGLTTQVLSPSNVAEVAPGSAATWQGALYTEDDGRAEPFLAVPALAKAFMQRGGVIATRCAARGIETQAGSMASVVTEKGTIKTSLAVVSGGYWSGRFLHNLGVRLPQLGVVNSVMRTTAIELGHARTLSGGNFAARKRQDGGYTVAHNIYSVAELTPSHVRFASDFLPLLKDEWRGFKYRLNRRFMDEWQWPKRWQLDQVSPFEQVRMLDPAPSQALLDDALRGLQNAFPAFSSVQPLQSWAGMIDVTPDAVPVIDAVKTVPGLCVATGFSGHGFGIGLGAGKLIAEIALGEKPCVDPTPFELQRFQHRATPQSGI